jgi:hypothetical protein
VQVVAGREIIERHWLFKHASETEIVSLLRTTVDDSERKLTKHASLAPEQGQLVLIGLNRLWRASFE